ncbi:unnamed protein product [Prorocentrum cordatum]|uniref:Uncharacterized protein n=1 Tax=Prorocentrum cordatum TaxID=2364126 RepID=A0ABN9T897_9DINO|nr:unnamed protein product [Polarella glacialis]
MSCCGEAEQASGAAMGSDEADAEQQWQVVSGDDLASDSEPGGIHARPSVPEAMSDAALSGVTGSQSDSYLLVDDEQQLDVPITVVFVTPDGAEGGHETFPCVPDYGMLWRSARGCVPARRRIVIRMDGELLSNANARRLISLSPRRPSARRALLAPVGVVLHVDFEDASAEAPRGAGPLPGGAPGGAPGECGGAPGPRRPAAWGLAAALVMSPSPSARCAVRRSTGQRPRPAAGGRAARRGKRATAAATARPRRGRAARAARRKGRRAAAVRARHEGGLPRQHPVHAARRLLVQARHPAAGRLPPAAGAGGWGEGRGCARAAG